jgi:adenylate cyclase
MTATWRPTLRQVFVLAMLGLVLGLGLLFYLGLSGSEKTILNSSDNYRRLASSYITSRVTDYLNQAPMAVGDFERQAQYGVVNFKSRASVQRALLSLLLANENISEATLTYAETIGPAKKGQAKIDPTTAGQIAIVRSSNPHEFIRRLTWYQDGKFVAVSDKLMPDSPPMPMPTSTVPDPTQHPTFQTTYHEDYGQLIPTDLHWAQLDQGLPEAQRRVEVSAQKTVEDAQGNFAGVLRVGLLAAKINEAVEQHITGRGQPDQHLIFVCDQQGRLITGFPGHDRVTVIDDDLRIPAAGIPEPVTRALQDPALPTVDEAHPLAATTFRLNGRIYLGSFQYLPGTQDWIVGIVVPRAFYLGDILRTRNTVLGTALAIMALIFAAGTLILRSVLRAQSLVRLETGRMNRFEFAASFHPSPLRDVQEVLGGLEKAKAALRAMSKYVPVSLVRQLYRDGEEPRLGARPTELSVLFTDIRDFTAIAEQMPPARLAEVLGRYLEVMAGVIQGEKGTIDKYIGDAVMVFWNAPEPVAGHEVLACRTALRCGEALQELYARPDWGDAPRFETRFGLHRCQASVGHFGSPERFNYTAIGDGINLTSRLEALNKYYGTMIIASETIRAAARDEFDFRLLDYVAVKGKMQGIAIYELLARITPGYTRPPAIVGYEEAFAYYQQGDFARALSLLEQQPFDSPSVGLAARCREFISHPPLNWTGIYGFTSK